MSISIVAVFLVSLLVFPTLAVHQSVQVISSHGMIKSPISWLHTDGAYIRNEDGEIVSLRGLDFIEPAYRSDALGGSPPGTLAERAERFKELGVNYVRLEIDQTFWDENRDTNGDGIGNRDFTMQAIHEFTSRGIYVIPGLHGSISENFYTDTQAWIDWLIDSLVTPNLINPGVAGIYIWNEPRYGRWGGTDLGGGVTSGYWDAVKEVCRQIHEANPNLLMVVHAEMFNGGGFCPVLKTDPIPTPNVVYTWHYYYAYENVFDPYMGWLTGILDPTWQYAVDKGLPFYQSYYLGNYAKARQEFEQWLYDKFLWVPTELNLPIVNDEFSFSGNDEHYVTFRACRSCLAANNGVPQRGVTFWTVSETLDAPSGNPVKKPADSNLYPTPTYCPICGEAMPRPREDPEPGYPQVMHDFLQILNKYNCNWAYFAWHGARTYDWGGGLTLSDMYSLSGRGEIWEDYLSASAPT